MTAARTNGNARLTIDLDAIVANYLRLSEMAGGAGCAAVVKADAYGLGAERVAPALREAGCATFFVATTAEAISLRHLLDDVEIVVLAADLSADGSVLAEASVTPVINNPDDIRHVLAQRQLQPAYIHVDTGMNRLGLSVREYRELLDDRELLERLKIKGLISHLACADEPDHALNEEQRTLFGQLTDAWPGKSIVRSLANSSGIFLGPEYHYDLVRPGMALYGLNPVPGQPNPMRNVVTAEAKVLQVRSIDTPGTVGYGASFRVGRSSILATIAIGYADGILRSLGNCGAIVVNGRTVPIAGRISMDLTVADISALPPGSVKAGDWVELFGPAHPADDLAREAATIGYEVLTSLGHRYQRSYLAEGRLSV